MNDHHPDSMFNIVVDSFDCDVIASKVNDLMISDEDKKRVTGALLYHRINEGETILKQIDRFEIRRSELSLLDILVKDAGKYRSKDKDQCSQLTKSWSASIQIDKPRFSNFDIRRPLD